MHSGLRLAAFLAMAAGGILGIFVIVPAITNRLGVTEGLSCSLSIIGGVAIGLGATWATERALRAVWPSGRQVITDEESIVLHERSGATTLIKWSEPVDILAWHFVVPKGRGWVAKGWYCVACQLTQAEQTIVPYAFMKPTDGEAVVQGSAFPELISRKHAPAQGNEHQLKQIGEQEPLRMAERNRWENGAEMSPADFVALVAEIKKRASSWPGK